uniref:DUF7695 domain-containing protein n=1 Tax=viral metagenome TaxID=1070528 RepID=A0A6M3LEM0_9ZZZZ
MIISNKAKCLKCGDVIESRSVHDFVWCNCHSIAVDGGREYLRRVGEAFDMKELSEIKEDSIVNKEVLAKDFDDLTYIEIEYIIKKISSHNYRTNVRSKRADATDVKIYMGDKKQLEEILNYEY